MDEKKKKALGEIIVFVVLDILVIVLGNYLMRYFIWNDLRWMLLVLPMLMALELACVFGVLGMFKDSDRNLGFSKSKIWLQILYGSVLFFGMLLIFKLFGNSCMGQPFRLDIILAFSLWDAFSAAVTEELAYRGLLFTRLKTCTDNTIAAIVISSVLFGASHFLVGDIRHIIMSTMTGVLLCTARVYLKNCTLVSTMTAHFLYDFLMCYIVI